MQAISQWPFSTGPSSITPEVSFDVVTIFLLNRSIHEYKIVVQALQLVSDDSKVIFEEYYIKNKGKWHIINNCGLSERTYFRKKTELIEAIHNEIKKLA